MEEMTKESSTRVHLPEEVSRNLAQLRQAALRAAGH